MKVIKHKGKALKDTIKLSKVYGHKVLSKEGKNLGNLREIHIDPKKLTIEGVLVDRGIFGESNYIGKNYIEAITSTAIILKITPITDIEGRSVYDSNGRKVGKVKSMTRSKKTNNIASIVVERGIFGGKDLVVQNSSIKEIGKSVMLKVPVEK